MDEDRTMGLAKEALVDRPDVRGDSPVDPVLPGLGLDLARAETSMEATDRTDKAAARERRRTRRGQEKAGKKAGMPVRATSVSVPASLAASWKDRARRDGATLVDVLLSAVASQRDDLPALVREQAVKQRPQVVPASDGLFVQRVESTPDEPYVTVPLRMLSANVDILDGLVHEAGAESRSALVTAALRPWLALAAAS